VKRARHAGVRGPGVRAVHLLTAAAAGMRDPLAGWRWSPSEVAEDHDACLAAAAAAAATKVYNEAVGSPSVTSSGRRDSLDDDDDDEGDLMIACSPPPPALSTPINMPARPRPRCSSDQRDRKHTGSRLSIHFDA